MIHPRLVTAYGITLQNPWAHLVAHHGKDVENRTWMPWDSVNTLLIHAGKDWDKTAERRPDLGEPHTSAVVAVADLAYACDTSRHLDALACACGSWAQPGRCHWKLTNVQVLPEPIPASGRQGLWRPAPDLIDAVHHMLAGTYRKP